MDRNTIVGWLLGGAGIVIAIIALALAVGARGGDYDGAANAEMDAMTAAMAAQDANIQALADQVSSLQAELAAADTGMAEMQAAMDEMGGGEAQDMDADDIDVAAMVDEALGDYKDYRDALETALQEAITALEESQDDGDERIDIEAALDDALEDTLNEHEAEHAALEAELEDARNDLDDVLDDDGDDDADYDAAYDALDELQERLDWLETAAAPAFTQSYVAQAIRRFDADGMQPTFDYYNTMDSVSGDLYLFVLDSDYKIVVHPTVPLNIGMDIRGPGGTDITGYNFGAEFVGVDESGKWIDYVYLNPTDDFAYERKHSWLMRHHGFIFGSGWYERDVSLDKDPQAFTRAFVEQARARYDANGRAAAIAYYNDPDSIDGQWYVYIVDEDDALIATAPHQDLLGDDIKTVVDDDGYELGVEIAKATEQGNWINYLWPNPASGEKERKRAWVIRHDGLIFGSGYYESSDETAASNAAATQAYVKDAIARYSIYPDAEIQQAALDYYNTTDSVEGDFYLFVLDESGELIVHPTVPSNIGKNIDGPLGTDVTGYNFGADFKTADENGKWVDYVYLNPADGFAYERKHSWLVKHDGLIFGSGWYERDVQVDTLKDNPRAYARALVEQATARYDANGRAAIAEQYNRPESVDGQWYVFIVDEDDEFLAHAATPERVGTDVKALTDANGYAHGQAIAEATEAGGWLQYTRVNPATGMDQPKHSWVIRHDGLIFGSGYYE